MLNSRGPVNITNNTFLQQVQQQEHLEVTGGISTQGDPIVADDLSLKSDESVLKFPDDDVTLTHQPDSKD